MSEPGQPDRTQPSPPLPPSSTPARPWPTWQRFLPARQCPTGTARAQYGSRFGKTRPSSLRQASAGPACVIPLPQTPRSPDSLFTEQCAESPTIDFDLPECLENGEYLLRVEHIGLHTTLEPQFYLSCAQINVSGGSGSYSPAGLLSFPGAYSMNDSGLKANLYWPIPTEYM